MKKIMIVLFLSSEVFAGIYFYRGGEYASLDILQSQISSSTIVTAIECLRWDGDIKQMKVHMAGVLTPEDKNTLDVIMSSYTAYTSTTPYSNSEAGFTAVEAALGIAIISGSIMGFFKTGNVLFLLPIIILLIIVVVK